jgi:alkylation response protein AidB-like acyl-CoA dehydrogenase
VLRATTVRFIEARFPMAEVRRFADAPDAFDPARWREAGELGWYGLFVPEEFGGGSVSGSPLHDAVLVAEARGRYVQPGPFTGTNVVALAIARDGTDALKQAHLGALAAGDRRGAWGIGDASGVPEAGAVRVERTNDGFALHGAASLVAEGAGADVFVVTVRHNGDGSAVSQFVVPADHPGVTVAALDGLDLTQRFARVEFDGATLPHDALLGTEGAAHTSVDRQVDVAAVLTMADSVGAMRRLLDMTVDYAKQRIAFGRPIGSFQALKHMLADAALAVEVSAAALGAATDAVVGERATASEIVSMAKAYVADAGVTVAQTCFQAHGGIAFTWEHDVHFYMRRLQTNRVLYGDPQWHRERICRLHGLTSDGATDD